MNQGDDDIIILSSDSDTEESPQANSNVPNPINSNPTNLKNESPATATGAAEPSVKIETPEEPDDDATNLSSTNNCSSATEKCGGIDSENPDAMDSGVDSSVTSETPQIPSQSSSSMVNSLAFDAFALFSPENASLPIEDRLSSFINNVQSLTDDKIKLENAERDAKRQRDEAESQLKSANLEISKLKENLTETQSKINQQTDSIAELHTVVDTLKKQGSGSKSKLKCITTTLMNLQAKMLQILEDAEIDNPVTEVASGQKTTLTNCDLESSSQGYVILKENIENFEKDFETKFSQIEEQDKEIKDELVRTNAMLQRIQNSIMEQFPGNPLPPVGTSTQLTYESMDAQDMTDDPIQGSSHENSRR